MIPQATPWAARAHASRILMETKEILRIVALGITVLHRHAPIQVFSTTTISKTIAATHTRMHMMNRVEQPSGLVMQLSRQITHLPFVRE
ncbi:hypothetical protein AN958_05241 [Leucoagaricus sp. SymC.cos]|nr:hypothetical protein AN958_05241 [Leucoagaricus sp. SymC.cos]